METSFDLQFESSVSVFFYSFQYLQVFRCVFHFNFQWLISFFVSILVPVLTLFIPDTIGLSGSLLDNKSNFG